MIIPILENHDQTKVIGQVYSENGQTLFKFNDGVRVTREQFFDIFNCGAMFDDVELDGEEVIIKSGRILCFSLSA